MIWHMAQFHRDKMAQKARGQVLTSVTADESEVSVSMQTVLVTGANGFIGRCYLRRFGTQRTFRFGAQCARYADQPGAMVVGDIGGATDLGGRAAKH